MDANAPTFEQVLAQAQSLSSLDRLRLIERLFATIERDMETLSARETEIERRHDWQALVERTAGALADDPIERPPQGDYDQRDTIL